MNAKRENNFQSPSTFTINKKQVLKINKSHPAILPQKMRLLGLLCLLCLLTPKLQSQTIWENPHSEIYNYLYRMAQKGLIVYNDNIRPIPRIYIEHCLDTLLTKQNQLTPVERKELNFYKQEFSDGSFQPSMQLVQTKFLKKDTADRWRMFTATGNNTLIRIDPILSVGTIPGNGNNVIQGSNGLNIYGYLGKHWGFYLSYNDITERGTAIDSLKQNTPETGIVTRVALNHKSQNYQELRGGIAYSWKNGVVSFGQDYLTWGYGENGRIVLSDKAPTYPYLRFDYKLLPWLSFNFTHAWLNSNIIDSTATYNTGVTAYGGQRIIYVSKYMSNHSIQITPTKGLDISLGENIIFTDRLNIGYLNPIFIYAIYDNLINNGNNNAGSNKQVFLQLSSRNQIRKTHLYATLFIDEIRLSTLFDPVNSRNQLGFTLGGSVTDIGLPYLTLGMEYTRINPFVYRNLLPAQNYTHDGYLMGDWMGNNADRLLITAKYTPLPRLKILLRYQAMRKGGPGTLDQQYFQQPQPHFLFDLQSIQKEFYSKISYECTHKLYINAYLQLQHTDDKIAGTTYTNKNYSLGFTYGL